MIEGENGLPFILTRIQMEDMYSYRLKHFGNRKRERLIEKWYSLGKEWSVRDNRELDAVVESASRTINELLGRFSTLMPATPLTVLSILQTIDITGTTIVNGHSYAYERLVQHSMDRLADGSPITQNVYESTLSNLAYKMLENKQWAIPSNDLVQELSDYSERALLGLDVVKAISRIERSRILVRTKDNKYKFRYPYLYYYFCGLYISKNLNKKDVKAHIEYMASKLHVVEYGNIMIFICHFVNNEEILQNILLNALCTLDGVEAFDFNTPHALLDEAFSDIGKLLNHAVVGDETDVRSARERDLDYQDKHQLNDGTVTEESSDSINDSTLDSLEAGNIISALRIMDVLGQILRSYPGDFTGENKKEAVEEIKNLSMRIVGIIYEGFSALKGEIVNDLFKRIKHDYPRASDIDLKEKVQLLFNSVVFSVAYCMVHKASCTIATPILIPVLESMADEMPDDLTIRIMLSDISMLSQTNPQYERIIATHRCFKNDNHHYAQETLRMLVAQHLRHRRCGETMRDRLCTEFGLKKIDVLPPPPVAADNS